MPAGIYIYIVIYVMTLGRVYALKVSVWKAFCTLPARLVPGTCGPPAEGVDSAQIQRRVGLCTVFACRDEPLLQGREHETEMEKRRKRSSQSVVLATELGTKQSWNVTRSVQKYCLLSLAAPDHEHFTHAAMSVVACWIYSNIRSIACGLSLTLTPCLWPYAQMAAALESTTY